MDSRLLVLRETAIGNKANLDMHASSMECITTDGKRKWEEFSMHAENDAKDCADYSAVKHCRMELLFQQWYVGLSIFGSGFYRYLGWSYVFHDKLAKERIWRVVIEKYTAFLNQLIATSFFTPSFLKSETLLC